MSLPGLHTLHLGQTPVNMKNEGHALVDRSRAMVVGRLASIRKLDGTAVSTEERNELERYYLALSTKHQGDASVDFPRLEELIAIHGAPRKATGAHDAKIKSRLVAVTIQVMRAQRVESETRRSLLKSMLVRQLNPIAMKLTKSLAFQLFVSADGDDSHWTHLDNDARPLSFYGVESDGAVIRVQVDG
ncbi:hypothetical protein GGI04_003032 [Coemansia thaxteri]|nr:hypothetical protein GGI04_003032 [Coemansia thaxteri]